MVKNTDHVRVLLLKSILKVIDIRNNLHIQVYGYTEKETRKLYYCIYMEFGVKADSNSIEDLDEIRDYMLEYFGVDYKSIDYLNKRLVYLLDEDNYYRLCALLKLSND